MFFVFVVLFCVFVSSSFVCAFSAVEGFWVLLRRFVFCDFWCSLSFGLFYGLCSVFNMVSIYNGVCMVL